MKISTCVGAALAAATVSTSLTLSAAENDDTTNPAAPEEPQREAAGQFKVDESAAERALERTLVQTGGLLLQPGQIEINSGISYGRDQQSTPVFITQENGTIIGNETSRQGILAASLDFRFGLPFDSQFEFSVPYLQINQSTVTSSVFFGLDESEQKGKGAGDVRVGFAKTILREKGWHPDLILRVGVDSDSGKESDNGVSLGGNGFTEYAAELRATKRQDPLVFTYGLGYEQTQGKNGIQPGDRLDLSLGVYLAASPETSLLMSVDQSVMGKDKIDGQILYGSDAVTSVLTIGASSIISHRAFLAVSVSTGLTEESPDYAINFSLGVRFTKSAR